MTMTITEIPLNKLVPSTANVRKTDTGARIEELAASIAAHGLLQNLTVRAAVDGDGSETGKFEVVAGGRRLAALKILIKEKAIKKTAPIPCAVLETGSAEEVSLAENVTICPMHPADQYEAFAKLHRENGLAAEDISARFGVSPVVVKQRLKLGAVSETLMQLYRDGVLNLDQLMGFTITDDHAAQERVLSKLGTTASRYNIKRALTEGQVSASDRRALFVGVEAYEAAGGVIVRDLFDEVDGGFLNDPALLDKLVLEKLEAAAQAVTAEGWKWVTVTPEFNYGLASDMRRAYAEPVSLTDEEQSKLDALETEYESLSIQYPDEIPDEVAKDFVRLESDIEALRAREEYRPEDIANGGAFVSLGYDGEVRIERGFVRVEDEPITEQEPTDEIADPPRTDAPESEASYATDTEEDEPDGLTPLSDRLVVDLTAHRTAALRDKLAQNPDTALIAVVHALAARTFYASAISCLEIKAGSARLSSHALDIDETPAQRGISERHEAWAKQMPRDGAALWSFVTGLDGIQLLDLLAHCASLTVDAVRLPWDRRPGVEAHADALAQVVALDMESYWRPTARSYFGRVPKARILEAVREAASEEAVERMRDMKKEPMAEAAEALVVGTGWLPALLRTPEAAPETMVAETGDDPPHAVAAE